MRRTRYSMAIPLAMVGAIACSHDPDKLVARGTVEVREVDVSPIESGRVVRVLVDEGDRVRAGDTIAVLSAPTLAAELEAAIAHRAALAARLSDLEAGARPPEIAAAEAELAAREAEAIRATRDQNRLGELLAAGAVAERDFESARSTARVAAAAVISAREALTLAKAGTRDDQVDAARAELRAADAALAARRATNSAYILSSPVDGVVFLRVAEPGDLLTPGGTVVRIGQTSDPWVRVYVPARALLALEVGDQVRIYPPGAGRAVAKFATDGADTGSSSAAGVGVSGLITSINPQAEFITRVALTETERADLLFGVKVSITDTTGRLKSGMPVTVVFPTQAVSIE